MTRYERLDRWYHRALRLCVLLLSVGFLGWLLDVLYLGFRLIIVRVPYSAVGYGHIRAVDSYGSLGLVCLSVVLGLIAPWIRAAAKRENSYRWSAEHPLCGPYKHLPNYSAQTTEEEPCTPTPSSPWQ